MARWFLNLRGWQVEGDRPNLDSYVLIAAPHTSNWDLLYMLAFAGAFDIQLKWMAKHSLFYPPMGGIMRALGGIPIVRHKNSNVVDAMVELFHRREALILGVPTEGSRSRGEYWKSGFYHIARSAGVPIVPTYLDYGRRVGGFGPALMPSDDIRADMNYFREFYASVKGKIPENFGPIRLREEDSPG